MQIGLDIGSTTIKIAVMDDAGNLLFHKYERHYSQIAEKILALHKELMTKFPTLHSARLAISGSGGIGVADSCGLQFVQEVFAEKICAEKLNPGTDAVIELGGEDAKILFLGRHFDARMNDSCAGVTGAFIDQMASLLNVETPQMNELAQQAQNTYTIASRCGVFAKSDIQPLLNQGAEKSDLAASIFHAVASQAITGLAKGRPISGNVLYLGGPLTFMSCLRDAFDSVLNIKGVCPENSLLYVAMVQLSVPSTRWTLPRCQKSCRQQQRSTALSICRRFLKTKANILFLRSVTLRKVSLSVPLRRPAKPLSVLIPAARPLKSLL